MPIGCHSFSERAKISYKSEDAMPGSTTMPCQVGSPCQEQVGEGAALLTGKATAWWRTPASGQAPAEEKCAPVQKHEHHGHPSWATDYEKLHHDGAPKKPSDAGAAPAANKAQEFVAAQNERRKQAGRRWTDRMGERAASMFTLKGRNTTPAIRLTNPDWTE